MEKNYSGYGPSKPKIVILDFLFRLNMLLVI